MKIGIDARMLGSEQAGLGRYVEQLILNLERIDSENQYVLFLQHANYESYECTNKNFKKVLADIPWYSWEEQVKFGKIIKKEKVDVMHFPHWNVPIFYNDPFVVTIHDLIMFHYPRPEATTLGPVKFWIKDRVHRLVLRRAVKKAKHILVTSEFTKEDVHKTLQVPLEKMSVTYQAPFKEIEHGTWNMEQILKKYNISKPFVLCVGNAYPHKNLDGLIKAWKLFVEKYGEKYQLVLVGKENYFYKKLSSNLPIFQSSNLLVFTNFIPDSELATLYGRAALYVFPSFYEGFGIPPLEAMAHGVPVVSSNRTCMPEVLGEAALYFDPENFDQMADVIYQGLTDEDVRLELKQKGRENLKRFSGEELARKTLEIYSRSKVKGVRVN